MIEIRIILQLIGVTFNFNFGALLPVKKSLHRCTTLVVIFETRNLNNKFLQKKPRVRFHRGYK